MSKVGGGSFRIVILILISAMAELGLSKFSFNANFHMHLINRMSSNAQPLMVRVRSGDNDSGERAVWQNGDFQFHFRCNFSPFGGTLFYCDFKHGDKLKRFNIFSDSDHTTESSLCGKTSNIYWMVKDDGFYRSYDDKNYLKMHGWYS